MDYPLEIRFKAIAFSNQGTVTDASGQPVLYVKQKAFRLRDAITIFTDKTESTPVCTIKAKQIIDFSATHYFADMTGAPRGSVRRAGARSIWKADYTIVDENENPLMKINEESAWVKILDGLLRDIPVAGMFSGYFLNPSYLVTRIDGTQVARIKKQPAFLEGRFAIEKLGDIAQDEELKFLLGCFTTILLERYRG